MGEQGSPETIKVNTVMLEAAAVLAVLMRLFAYSAYAQGTFLLSAHLHLQVFWVYIFE